MGKPLHPAYPFQGGAKLSPPDHRDWHYIGGQLTTPNPNNDLAILAPPVGDQQRTSSCTAWTAAEMRCALAARAHLAAGEAADLGDTFSAHQLYYRIRQEDGRVAGDDGATMRSLCKALVDYGASPERFDPWNKMKAATDDVAWLDTVPPAAADEAAQADYRISGYLRLGGTGQTLLNNILACLNDGYPVAIAISVVQSFVSTGRDGRVPPRQHGEQVLGGHALCLFTSGADNSFSAGGWLGGPNHWGSSWALDGWFFMPWSYVLDGTLAEAWSCR
jgi:hypothetical protein